MNILRLIIAVSVLAQSCDVIASEPVEAERATNSIDEILVEETRVANDQPAGTYESPVTRLRFDPSTEIQTRGLPEGQSDVTVQGGLFENTGFVAGAVTILDPQTGHYVAELPIDPGFLSTPEILTGLDNAIAGFNSNIATVRYAFRPIAIGGDASIGFGSDSLVFGSARYAVALDSRGGNDVGLQLSAAYSDGDGTIAGGDHEFQRYNVHWQSAGDDRQSDILFAYQDKFYGWPGAYTGFSSLLETDDTQTTLFLANHRRESDDHRWELSTFYRQLEDDYDFDRTTQESGAPGSFDHKTRAWGIGVQGELNRVGWALDYSVQATSDELVRSTDLTEGDFNDRRYLSMSLVPNVTRELDGGNALTWRGGVTFDYSSQDDNEVSPLFGVRLDLPGTASNRYVDLEFARTSQVPGYTVLNSRPAGLFGGNADLGREVADQWTLTAGYQSDRRSIEVSIFHRQDEDLVDWTYLRGALFARQANAVDIDVDGGQLVYRQTAGPVDVVAGYTYLDKDGDYAGAAVDASYYALNFAKHRATLALRIALGESIEVQLDNEYRDQEANPLRTNGDSAYRASLSLLWRPASISGMTIAVRGDNLTDDDFEYFPGTPAVGRQLSVSANYGW
ncbi:MAG: TonB-dependent receptor [Pseudomonadota bacterium]